MKLERYIDLTYSLKKEHKTICRCKHFSFIVKKTKILSIGFNNPRKTHPKNLLYNYRGRYDNDIGNYIGIHSEMSAVIRYGSEDCSNLVLINTRLNAANQIANSKPCTGCQNLLKQLNFKKVYYTTDTGAFAEL